MLTHMPQPPLVISFVRFSSANQIGNDSIRRQVALSDEYARERGWQIDQSIIVEAVSAFHGDHRKRGDFATLLERIKNGQIPKESVILVEGHDRMSRENVLEAMQQFISIINSGITVITLQDKKVYDKATILASGGMDLMMSLLLMVKANRESSDKSKRIKEVLAENRRKGAKSGNGPMWVEKQGDEYVLKTKETALVKRILSMIEAGDGCNRITRILNSENVASFNGKKWTHCYIRRIVANHGLYGCRHYVTYNEFKEGIYPALITKDQYLKLQDIIKSRTLVRGKAGQSDSLFTSIIYCGSCSSRMTYHRLSTARGRPKPAHYCCSSFERHSGCEKSNFITKSLLDRIVIEFVMAHQNEYLKPIAEASANDAVRLLISEKEREYTKLKKSYDKQTDPPDFLVERIKYVEIELKNLRGKLQASSVLKPVSLPAEFNSFSIAKQHSIIIQVLSRVEVVSYIREEIELCLHFRANGAKAFIYYDMQSDIIRAYNTIRPSRHGVVLREQQDDPSGEFANYIGYLHAESEGYPREPIVPQKPLDAATLDVIDKIVQAQKKDPDLISR